jgi:hypothetical protein
MKQVETTKVTYKKILFNGLFYHSWEHDNNLAIADATGYDISLKTDILNGYILEEYNIYTVYPEEYIHEQFCKL